MPSLSTSQDRSQQLGHSHHASPDIVLASLTKIMELIVYRDITEKHDVTYNDGTQSLGILREGCS